MNTLLTSMRAAHRWYAQLGTYLGVQAVVHSQALLVLFGTLLLLGGLHDLSLAQEEYVSYGGYSDNEPQGYADSSVTKLIKGAFGSLVMVVAGLGALVSAAMGAYRAAAGMLALAIFAFIVRGAMNVMAGYDDVKHRG